MIVFDIQCGDGHRFEGWFASSADYESQRERRILSCPVCGSEAVGKVPSATRLNMGAPPVDLPQAQNSPSQAGANAPRDATALAQVMYSRMLDEILTKSEDMGSKFPEEARRIHYKEAPARAIRGVASQEEHDALVDEGIPVARIPIPPRNQLN